MVFVVKRKLRRPKTGDAILDSVKQYEDPSFDIEKSRSPVEFTRASYTCGFHTKVLIPDVKIAHFRLKEVLGEPTRVTQQALEWVLRLPSREVIKITLSSKVQLHGFNMTKSIEKWVERLEAA